MKNAKTVNILIITLSQLACLYLFFDSFFNVSNTSAVVVRPSEILAGSQAATFDKVVFMVIDAMRPDLFYNETNMPFTMTKIHRNNSFVAHAHPPTVTLPRLKSMMTGMMPHFLDVVFNLLPTAGNSNRDAFEDDFTLLYQMHVKKWQMVLLGDETWTRVSPIAKNYFSAVHSDTTNSLFVTDTVQVDLNVTRHISKVMSNQSIWDLLVLHYLGLDHIGHVYGINQNSAQIVKEKMNEMDKVIETVWNSIDENTLFIVCSDHGMTNTGNHGGASSIETSSVLTFLSKKFTDYDHKFEPDRVNQIDIVATLSLLLNLPIPQKNVGKALLPVLENLMTPDLLLASLQRNLHQLTQTNNNSETNIGKLYDQIEHVSNQLIQKKAKFDHTGIVISLAGIAMNSIIIYNQISSTRTEAFNTGFVSLFIPAASPVWYLTGSFSSILLVYSTMYFIRYGLATGVRSISFWKNAGRGSLLNYFFTLVFVLHTVSLASSSFIEEEHMIWYYIAPTLMLLYSQSAPMATLAFLVLHRILKYWHQSGIKYYDNHDTIYNQLHLLSQSSKNIILLCGLTVISASSALVSNKSRKSLNMLSTSLIIVNSMLVYLFKSQIYSVNIIYLYLLLVASALISIVVRDHVWRATCLIAVLWILIERIENSLLILGILIQIYCFLQVSDRLSIIELSLTIYTFGMMTFYYFGRNISISSVDFSVAYQGLSDYQPAIIGLVVFLQIYLPKYLYLIAGSITAVTKGDSTLTLFTVLLMIHSVHLLVNSAMVYAMRDHLFIWSVFSPKFLWVIGDWFSLCIFSAFPILHHFQRGI